MSDTNLTSFTDILNYVTSQPDYQHLFNEDDIKTINAFKTASREAQRLYIALFMRKHRWIRTTAIKYPAIAVDLTPFFAELTRFGVLESIESSNDLDEILETMENHQLNVLIKKLKTVTMKTKGNNFNRSDMIEALTKHATSYNSVLKSFGNPKFNPVKTAVIREAKKIVGATAKRLHEGAWKLFSRVFYLFYPPQVNEDEHGKVVSYEFFMQSKLISGQVYYPQYTISRKTVIYQTREDLIKYQKACQLEGQILNCLERKEYEKVIEEYYLEAQMGYSSFLKSPAYEHVKSIPIYLRNATAGHVYLRCLTHVIGAFEAKKDYEKAVRTCKFLLDQDVLCLSYKGKFYERLAIDLERHLKKPEDAFKALLSALNDVHVKEHLRYALYLRAKTLHKNVKGIYWNPIHEDAKYKSNSYKTVTIHAPTLKKTIAGRRHVFMKDDGENHCSVEAAAMQDYMKHHAFPKGLHSESKIFHALFMLLLWDQIYIDQVEDAFRTHHQSLPLDFVSEDFYPRRKAQFDERLAALQAMEKVDVAIELVASWKAHFATYCLVDWTIELDHLKEILFCIGIKPLAAIFKRLLCNFRFNRSGFPDLILWDENKRKILLVEVKGPGDSLSPKQIMWLEYFTANEIPCEVAYVKPKKN